MNIPRRIADLERALSSLLACHEKPRTATELHEAQLLAFATLRFPAQYLDEPAPPAKTQVDELADMLKRECSKQFMVYNTENLPATLDRLLQRHYTLGHDDGKTFAQKRICGYMETLSRVGEIASTHSHLGAMQHIGRIIHEGAPDTIHSVTTQP